MNLAISNIAWEPHEDDAVAAVLRGHGVHGIEIAPTKWRDHPLEASHADIAAYRRAWADRGMSIVSLQALLFGRPELQLFGEPRIRLEMRDYLFGIIQLAAELGAEALVFGSPKNRLRGSLPLADANAIARDFFRELGEHAAACGTRFCIEANPEAYGGDYITVTDEAIALCRAVDHPGFGVNADLGGMTVMSEPVSDVLESAGELLGHFHASEPNLGPLGTAANHAAAAHALRSMGYSRWVSVEMRGMRGAGENLALVERALAIATRVYGERG